MKTRTQENGLDQAWSTLGDALPQAAKTLTRRNST